MHLPYLQPVIDSGVMRYCCPCSCSAHHPAGPALQAAGISSGMPHSLASVPPTVPPPLCPSPCHNKGSVKSPHNFNSSCSISRMLCSTIASAAPTHQPACHMQLRWPQLRSLLAALHSHSARPAPPTHCPRWPQTGSESKPPA
jgi:hypothetical protein